MGETVGETVVIDSLKMMILMSGEALKSIVEDLMMQMVMEQKNPECRGTDDAVDNDETEESRVQRN